jgi:hypothetical protein
VDVFGGTLDTRLTNMRVSREIRLALDAEAPKLAEARVPSQIEGEQRRVLEKALDESFVWSFRMAMFAATGLALASALCAALTIGPHRQNAR